MNAVTRRPWVFPVVCLFHFAIGLAMENQWAQSPHLPAHSDRPLQIELFTMPAAPSVAKARSIVPATNTPKPAQAPTHQAPSSHPHAGQTHPETRQPTTAPTTPTTPTPTTNTAAATTNHSATETTQTHATTVSGGQTSSSAPDRLTPIALQSNPPPTYPALSREAGETGRVLLRAEVSAEGRVQQLEIQDSSGFHRLDQAALNAVRHWRFQPATANGQAIAGVALIPLRFTLDH